MIRTEPFSSKFSEMERKGPIRSEQSKKEDSHRGSHLFVGSAKTLNTRRCERERGVLAKSDRILCWRCRPADARLLTIGAFQQPDGVIEIKFKWHRRQCGFEIWIRLFPLCRPFPVLGTPGTLRAFGVWRFAFGVLRLPFVLGDPGVIGVLGVHTTPRWPGCTDQRIISRR